MTEPTIGEVAEAAKKLGSVRIGPYVLTHIADYDWPDLPAVPSMRAGTDGND